MEFEESPIPEYVTQLDCQFGFDSFKRYNCQVIDEHTIIFASGISYTLYNHLTREKRVFYSRDKGGIGSIAIHPSKQYFAVAEIGSSPNVYIY